MRSPNWTVEWKWTHLAGEWAARRNPTEHLDDLVILSSTPHKPSPCPTVWCHWPPPAAPSRFTASIMVPRVNRAALVTVVHQSSLSFEADVYAVNKRHEFRFILFWVTEPPYPHIHSVRFLPWLTYVKDTCKFESDRIKSAVLNLLAAAHYAVGVWNYVPSPISGWRAEQRPRSRGRICLRLTSLEEKG